MKREPTRHYLQEFMTGDRWERISQVAATNLQEEIEWELPLHKACELLAAIGDTCLDNGVFIWNIIEKNSNKRIALGELIGSLNEGGIDASYQPAGSGGNADVPVSVVITPAMAGKLLDIKMMLDEDEQAKDVLKERKKLTDDEKVLIREMVLVIKQRIVNGEIYWQFHDNVARKHITHWLEKILVNRDLMVRRTDPEKIMLSEHTREALDRRFHDFIEHWQYEDKRSTDGEPEPRKDRKAFEAKFVEDLCRIAEDEMANRSNRLIGETFAGLSR